MHYATYVSENRISLTLQILAHEVLYIVLFTWPEILYGCLVDIVDSLRLCIEWV